MNASIRRGIALHWVVAIGLLIFSSANWGKEDFSVVVSIKPIHSIVAGLMKDAGEPAVLIDGQQTPFQYELNSQHKKLLMRSDLFIWVGPELEKSLQPQVNGLPGSVKVVELLSSTNLKILPSRHNPELRDPFFWMDDRNVLILLDDITQLLQKLDPKRSHIYQRNRQAILKPLKRIDKEYEYGYRGLKAGLGLMYFDTLRYFEQAYAFKTLDRLTGLPGNEERAEDLLRVRSRIMNREASCLLLDRSMPAPNLDLLTQGQGISIGWLDTLGLEFAAGPNLYLKLMQYNTDIIKQCVNADMALAARARAQSSVSSTPIDGLGGRFILTDHLGRTVTELDMKGRYSLIFFGYTSCPDVCPASLMVMTQAFALMGEQAQQIQPYFITLDPERDSVERMSEYIAYFDPRLIGLTGTKAMIKRLADQFRVKFQKVENDSSDSDLYAMDHTASLFLMAPDGSFITKFAHGINADSLEKELHAIIR